MRKIRKATLSIITALFILLSVAASYNAAAVRLVPIYSVARNDNKIALTFNCAWEDDDIPEILSILRNENIKCTFFLVGEFVERCPEAVRAIHLDGHEIANHSDTHTDMTILSQSEIASDIASCNNRIVKLINFTPILFRAPSGSYDNKTITAAESMSMYSIQWNVDSLDWKGISAETILENVITKVDSGSIILMHTGTPNTAKALSRIISLLKKDFSFDTVGNLIYKDDYYINPVNGIQSKQ